MNFKAIFLISILISSFLAISCDNAASINTHARTQGNDGNGFIVYYFTDGMEYDQYIDKDGYKSFPLNGVKEIAFRSNGRHECYNANI